MDLDQLASGKPADLDLLCFSNKVKSGFSRIRVIKFVKQK